MRFFYIVPNILIAKSCLLPKKIVIVRVSFIRFLPIVSVLILSPTNSQTRMDTEKKRVQLLFSSSRLLFTAQERDSPA